MDRAPEDQARRDALRRDPYPAYARARETPGLTFVPELDAWLVSRDADVREVLRRPEDFSSANALPIEIPPAPAVLAELSAGIGGFPTVVTSDGEAHQRYRAPLTRGLSPSRVAAAIPFVTERAEALVESFASEGRVELMGAYARRLPGEVIGHLLGLATGDVPTAIDAGYRAEELLFRPLGAEEQIAAARDVVALQHMIDGYVRRRAADPRDDLTGEMVRGLAPGSPEPSRELSMDQRRELVSNLQNLLLAGHLTTTALIGTAVLHLLRDRAQWELLCERPGLIPAAVEEAARFDAAVQAFRRVTTRPVALAGTDLPQGTTVLVAYGSANRDGRRHERPDEFDITRQPSRHVAFGHGVHACPGAQLAREQVRITLEVLTRRLPGLRLDTAQPVVMLPTLIHRSPETLPLVW
ncbi:cytochrome P450 [Planotetraspora sp. A-T 1434]|uniref:cytochrome P450 n=1 Tax=Planotetraspora sp. A-T 1434 TaxID=2979219 RepID=UPI0021C085D4|nr:cytochrome P450 [Planotetraspora sp. A-T 1434]MCT9930199.1 cytochrome P450 [Planotetraspora sp. A-T 1434]